jgi:hypothetical protein
LAVRNFEKIGWCQTYVEKLRELTLSKYDDISAHILTYIEEHTKPTEEELEKMKKEP